MKNKGLILLLGLSIGLTFLTGLLIGFGRNIFIPLSMQSLILFSSLNALSATIGIYA